MDAPAPARFGDRLNAFVLDASLFACACVLSALAVIASRGGAEAAAGFAAAWAAGWAAAFVLYHAFFGSEGRRTLGKRLFGLAVVDSAGEPPGFGAALGRALGYFASSFLFNAGFLWALRKDGRAWHDLLAGTRVVEENPGGPGFRAASAAASWLLAGAMAAAWFFLVVVAPGMARMQLLAQARVGLKSLAVLEDEHKKATGAYTDDLGVLLGGASPEAAEVKRALRFHLDQETVRLTAREDGYAIEAAAHDDKRTVLRLEGP